MLTFAVTTAASVATALDVYNNLKVDPKILFTIDNYSNFTLHTDTIYKMEGVTNSGMNTLLPGQKGAWTASKDASLNVGSTEGFILFNMAKVSSCVIYWRVGHKDGEEQKPNALGLGCDKKIGGHQQWEKFISRSVKTRCDLDDFYYQEYGGSHPVIQFCDNHVCVQGTLFSHIHGEAKIEILPVKATQVAPSLEDVINQKTINDHIKTHELDCESAGFVADLSQKVILGIVVLCFVLY